MVNFFGHVHFFMLYSFSHLDSVKWITLVLSEAFVNFFRLTSLGFPLMIKIVFSNLAVGLMILVRDHLIIMTSPIFFKDLVPSSEETSFWPPSMFYISVIILHMLHITNHMTSPIVMDYFCVDWKNYLVSFLNPTC